MGKIGQNYGIYWAKTIGDILGYSCQKFWDILGKNYGIDYGIYLFLNCWIYLSKL